MIHRFGLISIAFSAFLLFSFVGQAQSIVGPDQMNQCDEATFTVTITNASATQSACLLTITRNYTGSGVLYVEGTTSVTLHETGETFSDDPTDSTWDIDAFRGSAYSLPPGESISVSYDLETTCAAISGTEQITVHFEDCSDPGVPLQNVSSTSIEILPGALVISKIPSTQEASVGDVVTWTITVENTGVGTVSNVILTDILGPGLAFTSATAAGQNAGQTTLWDKTTTPALEQIAVGDSVTVQLSAEVIACSGLYNDVDAAWGCGSSESCFDTAVDDGTATASLKLVVANPALSFTPPNVMLSHCTDETAGLIQVTNSGAGWARDVQICCSIAYLQVDPTRLPAGTTYSDGCFQLPDIAPNSTFDLTFYVLHPDVDWCANGPSGPNTFQLTYANDCGIPFAAYPQFSTLSSESGPLLRVDKTGPDSLRLGETGAYTIAVEYVGSLDCGGGIPGSVAIVDTYPEGFTVSDAADGTVDPVNRTITWSYDPTVDPAFTETIRLQAPTDCGYCTSPSGGSDDNVVTASGTDCCGCTIVGTASAGTTILCEGYTDGSELFTSSLALDRVTTVRCSSDYAVTVTHTYSFADDPILDDLLLSEYMYFVEGNNTFQYSNGSASVVGATIDGVTNGMPSGQLEIRLSDESSVRGRTIVYTYTLIALDLDSPSCQASSYPIYAGLEIDPDATEAGYCSTMYADPPYPSVTAQPPSMSVSIGGLPEIQEACATYDVTITLARTSDLAAPYDVRLVLTNVGSSLIDPSGAVCTGVSPTDGTTCTSPIEGTSTYEWRFADGFAGGADTATITLPVTVPCDGPLADLSASAMFDDLCHDDSAYDNSCSTSAADTSRLTLSANVFVRKTPEILYATERSVAWTITVYNTGNGTAFNTWVDDALGSGLVYDSANSSISAATGATERPNLDHNGTPLNGVSWLIDELQPGEERTITVAAELVACTGLTNAVSAAWGCGESDCQPPRTDTSTVVIPPANVVSTSYSPTPVPMCSTNPATVTVKNAGVSTVYDLRAVVTLPNGLVYLGNPQVQVNGGAWTATDEPSVDGQGLTWTQAETPELATADPADVIRIRFDYTVFCGFAGGDLVLQTQYETPCGTSRTSGVGRFRVNLTAADIEVTLRQVSPAPGEPLDCGAEATWEIDVENVGSVPIPVVAVEASLDDGFTFVSSSGDTTYGPADGGSNSGQTVYWELADLPIDSIATLSVTAASTGSGLDCEALDIDVDAAWGCGEVDGISATFDAECTTTFPASSTLTATREPPLDLAASLSPDAIEACDATTTLTLSIHNTSTTVTTSSIDAVVTLPSRLSYIVGSTEIDCGSGFSAASDPAMVGQVLTWYDVLTQGGPDDLCESIPPNGTVQLRFDVAVSCYFTTQAIPITVYYYDCCGLTQYSVSTSATLTSLSAALTIDKSAASVTLDCYDAEDSATWTITVQNTGTGTADWVRVVDTLGSSLALDGSDSPRAGAGVSMGTNVVGWEIGPLAPGETFTATVTGHLAPPADDCSVALRRNTASALWGCGAYDGDPNTTAEATCDIGSEVVDRATVRIPNLALSPSDITPAFTCTGDGIAPSSGALELVVRNTGDGAVTTDFQVSLSDTTTGYYVADSFTALGGTLPLAAGSSQTLTFSEWSVSCADCTYEITAVLDDGAEICECREDDNEAVLTETITMPDLTIDSNTLDISCYADGSVRIDGSLTLRNDGCGDPVTEDLRIRFRVFDGAGCSGTEIDTFTVTWTNVALAAGGGTLTRAVEAIRALDVCSVTDVSIQVEVDDNDQICECTGDNNTLCVGPFALALPDLEITTVEANVPTVCDAGTIDVTVSNVGSGGVAAGAVLRITGDATGEAPAPAIAAGQSVVVSVPLDAPLDCGDKTIAVTIDPAGVVCECSEGSNALEREFAVIDPDLVVTDLAAICQPDGTVRIAATVSNQGDEASGNVTIRVTLDGIEIESLLLALDPAETFPIDFATDPVSCGEPHVIRVKADAGNTVCECNETNNQQEASATCPCPALSVDKVVADIIRQGDSVGTAGPIEPGDVIVYSVTVANVGDGTAFGVEFSDTLPTGLVTETDPPQNAGTYVVSAPSVSGSLSLADGAESFATLIDATIAGGEALVAQYSAVATTALTQGTDLINSAQASGYTADGSSIPPMNEAVGDTSDADAEDPDPDDTGIAILNTAEPALTVDKTIVDITRSGESIGTTGPVEPGDVVTYRFAITNVGDGTAYAVGFDDVLPEGLETVAGGTYTVSAPAASGSLSLAASETTFAASINAQINGGATLTAEFSAVVTSAVEQGVDLVNTAEATGVDGYGTEIPDSNPALNDTTDQDAEDPDADDTGIAVLVGERPALSVDKTVIDILRGGNSIGTTGPVEPGDVVIYRYTIRNVGQGTAYSVEFSDTLPTGLVVETAASVGDGTYTVSDPVASGSLDLADGATSFATAIDGTIAGGATLTAEYAVFVTSDVRQAFDLINTATASGTNGAGDAIPAENPQLGDTQDDDAEDSDADDTGIAILTPVEPALSVDKQVVDVIRGGTSMGVVDPLLYGDVIVYQVTVRNVGQGTAYGVELSDTLPGGLEIETDAPGSEGSFSISTPVASGSLSLIDASTSFATAIGGTIAGGAVLTATYTALVTPNALPGTDLVNVARATGQDGTGAAIPEQNADANDTSDDDLEDPDADDTGIAAVRIGAPALVTQKTVGAIVRRGEEVVGAWIEPGDTVIYELRVTNVGSGPAQNVNLDDTLPAGFTYAGSSVAAWPSGSTDADPDGVPGPNLTWPLAANLDSQETIVVRFSAHAAVDLVQNVPYTNVLSATGDDIAGEPIPADNASVVPEDTDADDSDSQTLLGAVPALVTDKKIVNVVRDERVLGPANAVAPGDVLIFSLSVTNVGQGTAYDIAVQDELPDVLTYVDGSTQAAWPARPTAYDTDPLVAGGTTLQWDTAATLAAGERLLLTFEAQAGSSLVPGSTYVNELYAYGVDGAAQAIPEDRSGEVPADADLDDRDDVSFVAVEAVPALITTKRVISVSRENSPVLDRRVEQADVIRYELTVTNVGEAPAYNVGFLDDLPPEFAYVEGTTAALWPTGSSSADPLVSTGSLRWSLGATLRTNQRVVLTFDAVAVDVLYDSTAYLNTMTGFGTDGSGAPIPADQGAVVPGDIDPDDSSQAVLIARSSLFEGAGGVVSLPILRKTARTLGNGLCTGLEAWTDAVWFQTDIALFAASAFERFADVSTGFWISGDSLLPTWLRTAQAEGIRVAEDNLLQVTGLSSLGVSVAYGPLTSRRADRLGVTAEAALAERLNQLAIRAGLDLETRPLNVEWIFLEYAGGEPVYAERTDVLLGPTGSWTIVDNAIVSSSLGMGLLDASLAAARLLRSEDAYDRYVGWVLVDTMGNKVIALDESIARWSDGVARVPHQVLFDATSGTYTVSDDRRTLFDDASMILGLTEFAAFLEGSVALWPASDIDLYVSLLTRTVDLLDGVLLGLEADFLVDEQLVASTRDTQAADVVDLGLLAEALSQATPYTSETAALGNLSLVMQANLLSRFSGETGQFAASRPLPGQLSGLYGLLAVYDTTQDPVWWDRAAAAFSALEAGLWYEQMGRGLYVTSQGDDPSGACYTPLEIGLAVGALQRLAQDAPDKQAELILSHLAAFVRSIVDEAGLHLANILDPSARITVGTGGESIATFQSNEDLAPVLQRRLCLRMSRAEEPCSDLSIIEHEPWFQTDISMYAAYVLQNRMTEAEDVADANLVALVFHSTLGVPLDLTALDTDLLPADLSVISVPYRSASPALNEAAALQWDAATFERTITVSAIGMTLLREAQEARQALGETFDPLRRQEADLLIAAVHETIDSLNAALAHPNMDAPGLVDTYTYNTTTGRLAPIATRSTLFGQASLLWGLSEAYQLLSTTMTDAGGRLADVEVLLDATLETLETIHRVDTPNVLANTVVNEGFGWISDEPFVSTATMGILASALEHAIDVFGPGSNVGDRSLELLRVETDFLLSNLYSARDGYVEQWSIDATEPVDCTALTLQGQLGALRTLYAASAWLPVDPSVCVERLLMFDDLFWDEDLSLYRTTSGSGPWCASPLDLGITVDTVDRIADLLDANEARIVRSHLARSTDRWLDALRLQLPYVDGTWAPVFDRRVCLRSLTLSAVAGLAAAGDLLTYDIEVVNETEEQFFDLVLVDTLPDHVSLIGSVPPGTGAVPTVQWTVERLEPDQTVTWTVLVRVDEDVPPGTVLENCAVLTYANEEGEQQPAREGCAETRVQADGFTLDADKAADVLTYDTADAMHLATSLASLAKANASWAGAEEAQDIARVNLGILLAESGLGVPLVGEPTSANERGSSLAAALNVPIVLPYDAGTPILARGTGFISSSGVITPAAVGWTLAREVQYIETSLSQTPLSEESIAYVAYIVTRQLGALADVTNRSPGFVPYGIRPASNTAGLPYVVTDNASSAVGQASLLVGLIAATECTALEPASRAVAEQIAVVTFNRLAEHWSDELSQFAETLPSEAPNAVSWSDAAVIAQALRAAMPTTAGTARGLLERLAAAAQAAPASTQSAAEEAGRLTVLLVAHAALAFPEAQVTAQAGWQAFLDRYADPDSGTLAVSSWRRLGWSAQPRELATVFDLLLELAATPEDRATAYAWATVLLAEEVLGDGVQLVAGRGYFEHHTVVPCLDMAPVFSFRRTTPEGLAGALIP